MGITKLDGQAGKDAQKMVKSLRDAGLSPTESLADYFGLKTGPVNPKAKKPVNKNASIGQKAKSYATSAAMGLSDVGAGIVQGAAYAGDKVNEGINSVLGTDLETNAYDQYNDQYKAANANADMMRSEAGRSGVDFVRGVTEIAATVPAFFVGGGAGQGFKQGAQFAGRQAAIGAGVGAARYAENGKERAGNMAGGAIGGAVGGVIGEKVAAPLIGKTVGKVMRRTANKSGSTAQAAGKLVDDAIRDSEMAVSDQVRRQLVVQATKNLSKGKEVDAAALARQSLLERYNLKGTKAQISRDPIEWKNEVELAKNNPELNDVRIQNHGQVQSTWESLANSTNARQVNNNEMMESTFQSLRQSDDLARDNIKGLYDRARDMSGNEVQLNHLRFINEATAELEHEMLGSFVKGDTMTALKGLFARPDYKFTYGKSEELIKVINSRLKTTNDGSERAALGIIRKNLDNEVANTLDDLSGSLGSGASDGGLAGAQGAGQAARNAARTRFEGLEQNPLMNEVLNNTPVDDMFNKYVLRGKETHLKALVDDLKKSDAGKQSLADIQGATIKHFIKKASNANNGAVSPAALKNAMDSFGDIRMRAIFTPQQIGQINEAKQITDILLQQPLGSAVNHSNTASAIIPFLQNIVGRVPVGGNLLSGAVGTAAKKVTDVNAAGAAAKAMNGQAGVTKGSSLGLTDEQLEMLGMIPKRSGQVGAGLGANMGD